MSAAPEGLTRQDLVAASNLSRPTIKQVIDQLKADDWLVEAMPSGNGRVAGQLLLGDRAGRVAGIDIGHGHIHVAIADANGRILARANCEGLDIDAHGPAALALAATLLAECRADAQVDVSELRGVALGMPGPVTLDGKLASSLFLGNWTTVDLEYEMRNALAREFDADLGEIPILIENDANLGAHAEARRRPGCEHLLYLKLSTGIGMGLLLGGRIYRGKTGVAGEFGHVSVPAEARRRTRMEALPPECKRCGKADCLENLASCRAIVKRLRAIPGYPEDLAIETVIHNALHEKIEHPTCLRALKDAALFIGYALAEQVSVLDPGAIVLGGHLAAADELLAKPVEDAITAHSANLSDVSVEVLSSDRIDSIELEGAIAQALTETKLPAFKANGAL